VFAFVVLVAAWYDDCAVQCSAGNVCLGCVLLCTRCFVYNVLLYTYEAPDLMHKMLWHG
jgi:hypothetical protein